MLAQAIIAFMLNEFVLQDNMPEETQSRSSDHSSVEIRQIQNKKEEVKSFTLHLLFEGPANDNCKPGGVRIRSASSSSAFSWV